MNETSQILPQPQLERIDYEQGEFPHVVDNSILSQMAACRRLGFWSHIRCLTTETNVHLHAGAAYAEGLKALRKGFYEEGLSQEAALHKAVIALTKMYGNYDPPLSQAKSWINMVHSLLAYAKYYPLETDLYKPLEFGGKKCIEFSFAIPLSINHPTSGQPIIFAGRTDMIATDGHSIMLVDDKTTGQMGEKWPAQWNMHGQFPGYMWAAAKYGIHCNGVLVRGVSVQKTQTKHLQVPAHFSQWQIDRWYADMLQRLAHYIQCWKDKFWPVDGEFNKRCSSYGECAYKSLCTSPDPEAWIPGKFIVHRWNPLEKDMPDAD